MLKEHISPPAELDDGVPPLPAGGTAGERVAAVVVGLESLRLRATGRTRYEAVGTLHSS